MTRVKKHNTAYRKNKYVAGFLALFGGFVGIHRFYLGESGMGILYIMMFFFTFGIYRLPITMIIGFIEAFRYFSMSEEKFDRKFNRKYGDQFERKGKRMERKSKRKSTKRLRRANPFKRTALAKYKEYEIEGAIEDFNKALEIEPHAPDIHYRLACAYSLIENKDKTLHHLDQAVSNGLKSPKRILEDDDLAFIRIQSEFQAFRKNGFTLNNLKIKDSKKDDALLVQLQKLSDLRQKGILTELEFAEERKKLLRN